MLFSLRVMAAASIIAGLAAVLAGSVAQAAPSSKVHIAGATASSAVVKVHHDWRDDEDREHRHAYRHRDRDDDDDDDYDHMVVAPFPRVEHGRRVVVDAPFAHVYARRYGRHVVAPFVNIWIPR